MCVFFFFIKCLLLVNENCSTSITLCEHDSTVRRANTKNSEQSRVVQLRKSESEWSKKTRWKLMLTRISCPISKTWCTCCIALVVCVCMIVGTLNPLTEGLNLIDDNNNQWRKYIPNVTKNTSTEFFVLKKKMCWGSVVIWWMLKIKWYFPSRLLVEDAQVWKDRNRRGEKKSDNITLVPLLLVEALLATKLITFTDNNNNNEKNSALAYLMAIRSFHLCANVMSQPKTTTEYF